MLTLFKIPTRRTRHSFIHSFIHLLLMGSLLALASPSLAQPEDIGNPPTYDLEGPYDMYSGPFRIRVEFLFLYDGPPQPNWTDSLDLQALAEAGLANLNNAYNPHDIYFYGTGDSPCTATYINEEFPDDAYELEAMLNPNALNVIVRTDAGVAGGTAHSLPSSRIDVQGRDSSGVLVTETSVLVHEVGHCLGLFHVFTDTDIHCAEDDSTSVCDINVRADICNCCGDSVCDTPPTDNKGILVSSDCSMSIDSAGNPTNLPVELFRNYMAYADPASCRDRFTPGQAARMWGMLTEAPEVQAMQMGNQEEALSDTLSGGGTYGNIIVGKGTTLEITSSIEMEPGAYIKVEKGGQGQPGGLLRVRATISGACGELWKGIIVEGSAFLPQTTANQGKVVVHNNGKIEHAEVGIDVQDGDGTPGTGGGIVEVLRGTLEDNLIGIRFGQYTNGTAANVSRLFFPGFYTTDSYRGGGTRPIMVQANPIRQLSVFGGTFEDRRTACKGPAIGIELLNASANIQWADFKSLSTAIWADKLNEDSGSFNIHHNGFIDCYTDIRTNMCGSFTIFQNDFTIQKPAACPSTEGNVTGVWMDGATTGFTFRENSFVGGATSPSERIIGVLANDTGEGLGNTVRDNSFTRLFEGALANLDNGGEIDGLLLLCNTFADAAGTNGTVTPFDIHVGGGATVKTVQGEETAPLQFDPAGNVFSDLAFTFFNDSGNGEITYHFHSNGTNEDPDNTGDEGNNILAIPHNNAGCTGEPPCDMPPCDFEIFDGWQDGFNEAKSQWQAKLANLGNITDTVQLAAEQDTIRHLRSEMNALAGNLLQQYALDTNTVAVDSITAWLERTETYQTDMRLARHRFFTGDFTGFDALWTQIPVGYNLTGGDQSDYNELDSLYGLVRPHLQSGGGLNDMGQPILDSLRFWSDWCSEPGYLSRSLLRRNGIETEADCLGNGTTGRSAMADKETNRGGEQSPLNIFPNPADGTVTIILAKGAGSPGHIEFYNAQGHLVIREAFPKKIGRISVQTSTLPEGLYTVKATLYGKAPQSGKLIINR